MKKYSISERYNGFMILENNLKLSTSVNHFAKRPFSVLTHLWAPATASLAGLVWTLKNTSNVNKFGDD